MKYTINGLPDDMINFSFLQEPDGDVVIQANGVGVIRFATTGSVYTIIDSRIKGLGFTLKPGSSQIQVV